MSEPIPPSQRAGYCCPIPTLEWTWYLGTEEHDLAVRILKITGLKCSQCGADYEFVTDSLYPVVEQDAVVHRVRTKNLRTH